MKDKVPMKLIAVAFAGMLALVTSGSYGASANETPFLSVKELKAPVSDGAREPSLAVTQDGRVLMSWSEPVGDAFAIRMTMGSADGWSDVQTITQGSDLFVNWADSPSVIALPDGTLAAHWLRINGADTYAYDVNIALSKDEGRTWGLPMVPHRDFIKRQHGFVSLLPVAPDSMVAIWLDGRDYSSAGGFAADAESAHDAMALRSLTMTSVGAMSKETVLDARTCTCCQTAAAITETGAIVVAYRDRTEDEIRDIAIVRFVDGLWSAPAAVHSDGWRIEGCPVNGPAIDASGKRVAVAWFSAAADTPQVNVAFSNDEGMRFESPVRVDQGSPAGRVDVLLLADGSALVSWLELTSIGEELRLCRVVEDDKSCRPKILAINRKGRTSGFPKMVRSGEHVFFAWTQPSAAKGALAESGLTVRTLVAKLKPGL